MIGLCMMLGAIVLAFFIDKRLAVFLAVLTALNPAVWVVMGGLQ